jgi:hypothetical protein
MQTDLPLWRYSPIVGAFSFTLRYVTPTARSHNPQTRCNPPTHCNQHRLVWPSTTANANSPRELLPQGTLPRTSHLRKEAASTTKRCLHPGENPALTYILQPELARPVQHPLQTPTALGSSHHTEPCSRTPLTTGKRQQSTFKRGATLLLIATRMGSSGQAPPQTPTARGSSYHKEHCHAPLTFGKRQQAQPNDACIQVKTLHSPTYCNLSWPVWCSTHCKHQQPLEALTTRNTATHLSPSERGSKHNQTVRLGASLPGVLMKRNPGENPESQPSDYKVLRGGH